MGPERRCDPLSKIIDDIAEVIDFERSVFSTASFQF
jgi:hypothetical protein